ncbi:AsmA-like C-terminal region-containing protein [Verrucomicrobium sp. BvORR106]|uniref:AsmA-like C-terminal region-containing protein n=1 Tax=Verrucomicrobium sp. BvORR106 TaxID=1403819 RepID=UPI00056DB33E|nr:AsmA-like C-terminal region-containing protein [Verrucomicrobium sp. BvORR106]
MNSTEPLPKKKRRLRRFLIGSLVFLLLLAGGVWLGRQWIGDILAAEANSRLDDAGVYMTWEDANWIPGPGVSLTNVTLYRDDAKTDAAVKVSHLSLVKDSPGWRNWNAGRFTTKKAHLELLEGETRMQVEDFGIDLNVRQDRVELVRAQGLMEGWNALITGEYAWTSKADLAPEEQAKQPPREKGQALKSALRFRWLAPTQKYIKIVSKNQPPEARLDFRKAQPEDRVKMNLELSGGDFTWRGIHLTEAAAKIDTAAEGDPWSRIEIPLLQLSSGGGTATMSGHVDPGQEHILIKQLDSSLDLPAVIRQLSPNAVHLQKLRSEGTWKLTGTGLLPFSDPGALEWHGHLELEGHLAWALESGTIHLDNLRSDLALKDRRASLKDVKATLWGGTLSTDELDLDYSQPATSFKTSARLAGANLDVVMRSFGSTEPRQGTVTGTFSGGGVMTPSGVKGSGSIVITQARFYQVPFLGALHLLINPLQPEFGKDVASRLDASYHLGGGTLVFDQLDLSSNTTKVDAKGSINLESKYAQFEAQARLKGLVLKLATGAFSELLSFEGAGTLPNLKWQLKFAPGTQIVKGTVDAATGILKEGAKIGVEGVKVGAGAAEGILEGTGKAAKEIFKLPGRLIPGRK